MESNFKRNLVISSSLSLLILIVSSTASYLSIDKLLESNRWVNHTQDVIYNMNQGHRVMLDAQTSVRGFIITGKKDFLSRYYDSEELADDYLEKVAVLTRDNQVQQKNLAELLSLNNSFFNFLDKLVNEKMSGKIFLAEDLETGKDIMNNVRQIFKRMENEEQDLLRERIATSEKYGLYSSMLIVIAAIISLLVTLFFFYKILNDFRHRVILQKKLEKSEYETAERIKIISKVASQISEGNFNVRVANSENDALGSVGASLNNMAAALEASFNTLSDKEWLQTGIATLNKVMIGEKTIEQLASDVINFIAAYTNSNAGVLYLLESNTLCAASGFSYIPSEERAVLKIGQGLAGQAAISGQIMKIEAIDADAIQISYALGEAKPTEVIAVPLIDDKIAGVAELASTKKYSDLEIEFLKTAAHNISIAIKGARSRKRVQELLEETQAQSEELRSQHSELESINAELETQTEKLQASEEELRVQQEELQQTNEELAERSVLLEEKNVEIQKKSEDLELTTRYKSEFLANMSHELRTPLNSILLLSRLLAENNEKNMTPEQIEFASVIQSSGNGLLGLIDEILDLSKIEAGKMELELSDISVKEIADSLNGLFKEVAKAKNIKLEIDMSEAPLAIKTDRMRLEQILKNLISNAIKFTSEGFVRLEIKKHREDERMISFAVIDTGIGIPKEKQYNIFEAFQQADGSTKRKYGGTGLGLSISRELAKLLKGEIKLQSAVGQGSNFTLIIPIAGLPMAQNPQKEETVPAGETASLAALHSPGKYISTDIPEDVPDDRAGITENDRIILIIEDDTSFAKSLLEFTKQRGYKGIVCVRGDEALNLAVVYKPIGILLDIQLPIKSGWQVIEELKNNSETKHIPVHMMSSHKMKKESLLKGAINFLDKPIAFEQIPEIFKKIEHIVNRESQKVLIVEDNPKHAKALAYFLETYDINSEIKSDISQSIDALQKTEIDCVILDMGIPARQAYETLENIKKNPGLENLPIIVFTGKSLSMQ
ncbi:MAG TPA: ATP-binding protein, partial [Flavobacterium sp.]|nr:ATP-binding protein [Flavobacterium sp.]